ncbi:PP2C family protein-serine/threonine phosphatase [Agrobacterium tumefaciens]|uniref:PP2C family protein-serine/threonine phosphatase n=1 Tax=Agrobacterium tumefaciens TaxID=358 RepID=UPI003BA0F209
MTRRSVWAATDVGLIRSSNEDSYGLPGRISSGQTREAWQGELLTNTGWAVIADGMGGHEGGEIASHAVVETFYRLAVRASTEANIVGILEEANAQIYTRVAAGFGRAGMGSTIVGVSFRDYRCFVFNVGDSRVYLKRKGELRQLSTDDTLRSRTGSRSHALTQSLGGARAPLPIFPHVASHKVQPEDEIVLCSDGLSDMISEEQIRLLLDRGNVHPALALVDAAVAAGGRDNVTAIVIGPEPD